jgi:phage-related protein
MKTLPAALLTAKNNIDEQNPWLVILDIDLKNGTFLHLVNNNEDITFQSKLYTAIGFEIVPPKESTSGEIPSVTLNISNVTRAIQIYLEELSGAIGAEVTMSIINAGLLSEDYTELTMIFEVIATKCSAQFATFTLGAPNPLHNRFPVEQYIAAHCNWRFKSPECAYAGTDTTCKKTWTDCKLKLNSTRFGGYPGLQGGIRIV